MCGIAGLVGAAARAFDAPARLRALIDAQGHRGPDDSGLWQPPERPIAFGHNRLSIIDLSAAGHGPMTSHDQRFTLTFNGEIYNYRELRAELADYPYFSATDAEVLLAAWDRWGEACLERLIGMFAFGLWDDAERTFWAVRDRFGVKPFYFHRQENGLIFSSEIKALHQAGVARSADAATWATYFALGLYDHGPETFWQGIERLPPGHLLRWREESGLKIAKWYDAGSTLAAGRSWVSLPRKGERQRGTCAHEGALERQTDPGRAVEDQWSDDEAAVEVEALLRDAVSLRLRADVPVGVCLSGGLDSALLAALVQVTGARLRAFTFESGDPRYDETPWAATIAEYCDFELEICRLELSEVEALAATVARAQDEPFGGLPTLGMAKVFAAAWASGTKVLLDGNGLDEAFAGYDYYRRADTVDFAAGPVQGARSAALRPELLRPDFARLVRQPKPWRSRFADPVADLQLRDLGFAKIPRAVRFADRVSMLSSCELREPFLDHRLVEFGLRQPTGRKIDASTGKVLIRRIARDLLPAGVGQAPKRPVQTPQREWLRGPLAPWAEAQIAAGLAAEPEWLDGAAVWRAWREFRDGDGDNSFPAWQWLSLGLFLGAR